MKNEKSRSAAEIPSALARSVFDVVFVRPSQFARHKGPALSLSLRAAQQARSAVVGVRAKPRAPYGKHTSVTKSEAAFRLCGRG